MASKGGELSILERFGMAGPEDFGGEDLPNAPAVSAEGATPCVYGCNAADENECRKRGRKQKNDRRWHDVPCACACHGAPDLDGPAGDERAPSLTAAGMAAADGLSDEEQSAVSAAAESIAPSLTGVR